MELNFLYEEKYDNLVLDDSVVIKSLIVNRGGGLVQEGLGSLNINNTKL